MRSSLAPVSAAGRGGLGRELAAFDRRGELRANALSTRCRRCGAAADEREDVVGAEVDRRSRARVGSPGTVAGARLDQPAVGRRRSTADAVEAEHADERVADRPAGAAPRAGPGSRLRRGRGALGGSAGGDDDEPLTTAATTTNTTRASRFSPSEIVNVWIGGVKYQFARRSPSDRGDERRQSRRRPTRRRRATGTAAARSRCRGCSRELGERRVSAAAGRWRRGANRGARAAGQGGRAPRARDDIGASERPSGWLMTWTSIRAGFTDHAADDRAVVSAASATPAGADHELGDVLERAARSAPRRCRCLTTSWYSPPSSRRAPVGARAAGRGPGEAVLRDDVDAEELTLSAARSGRRAVPGARR